MKTFKQILESATTIAENYDIRVSDFVKQITRGKQVDLETFTRNLETMGNPVERRIKNSTAWRDFKKDALKIAKDRKLIKRKIKAPYYVDHYTIWDEKVPVTHNDIRILADKMEEFAGNSFPDGDPHDQLTEYMQSLGWDAHEGYTKIVPVACKKYLKVKSYTKYLADQWDSIYNDAKADAKFKSKDNPHADHMFNMLGGKSARNPWK